MYSDFNTKLQQLNGLSPNKSAQLLKEKQNVWTLIKNYLKSGSKLFIKASLPISGLKIGGG